MIGIALSCFNLKLTGKRLYKDQQFCKW